MDHTDATGQCKHHWLYDISIKHNCERWHSQAGTWYEADHRQHKVRSAVGVVGVGAPHARPCFPTAMPRWRARPQYPPHALLTAVVRCLARTNGCGRQTAPCVCALRRARSTSHAAWRSRCPPLSHRSGGASPPSRSAAMRTDTSSSDREMLGSSGRAQRVAAARAGSGVG